MYYRDPPATLHFGCAGVCVDRQKKNILREKRGYLFSVGGKRGGAGGTPATRTFARKSSVFTPIAGIPAMREALEAIGVRGGPAEWNGRVTGQKTHENGTEMRRTKSRRPLKMNDKSEPFTNHHDW